MRRSLANRARLSRTILDWLMAACGEDFILGPSVSDEPNVPAALGRESLAEIVALHDAQGLTGYVTVGAGSYLDFTRIMPTFQLPETLGADLARVLKAQGRRGAPRGRAGLHLVQPDVPPVAEKPSREACSSWPSPAPPGPRRWAA